jgi:hypothetical protein
MASAMSDELLGSSELSQASEAISSSADASSSSSEGPRGNAPTGPADGDKVSDEDLRQIPRG